MAKTKSTSKSNASRQVDLNVKEAKEFLKHIIKNNRYLQEGGKPPVAVEVVGD